MSSLELIGACLSLIYVIMATHQNIFCWAAAAASSTVYVFVFYSASLYAEALLQVFFILSSLLGAHWWHKARVVGEKMESERYQVHRCSLIFHLAFITCNSIIGLALGYSLEKYTTQELSYADGLITCFSISTTFLVGRKVLENWIYWIVIDSVCIVVYLLRGLPITAVLYTLYIVLAIRGYRAWIKVGAFGT